MGTTRKWTNRVILGDSLLVMASLAEKEGLKGQVQMIYMDPPYGIKFGSNWQVSTRKRDVRDGRVEDVTRQPEQIRAFRDTWELGIHSYEDPRRVRVAGPFTVESLSPHRVLSEDVERSRSEAAAGDGAEKDLARTILDNLRVAGVQNTKRNERLKFDRLEPYAGGWIQAAGEYTDAEGSLRRVAISIGPEHGTVGQHHIQEAAKEALKGVGFDLLLVLGFAFDAHASETAREVSPDGLGVREGFVAEWRREYGKLPVLLVRMNPDLPLGDEFLKKTGAANLFMVFGEPDIDIRRAEDGRLEVEIRGVDIYDPTTGVIRNSSPDEIACWFIDSNYNEEAFFIRHAYFTGGDDPYDKLRRALRAEVNETAWESLYRTISRPFDPPETGKIAVKVINHYGDEVVKVYDVRGTLGAEGRRAVPAQTA